MPTIHEHYDLGPRTRITKGDLIRVSGGPYYVDRRGEKHSLGERGKFTFLAYVESESSKYIRAVAAFPESHSAILYVGDERPSPVVPGMIRRPYKIRSLSTKEPDMATKKKKPAAKKSTSKKPAAKKPATKPTAPKKPAGKPAAKPAAKPKAKANQGGKAKSNGKLSQIAAAIKVLGESKEPMTCKQMVEAMGAKGYWTSPGGKTPHATLAAAILRELKKKDTPFKKVDRGLFTVKA